jgi:hypothetical protein
MQSARKSVEKETAFLYYSKRHGTDEAERVYRMPET